MMMVYISEQSVITNRWV